MNKKLTFVAMLAIALSLGACNSKPGSSSSDSGTDNPTTSVTAPTTSSTPTTTAPTPTTSVVPPTTSVTPDTSSVTPSTSTPAPSTSTPTPVEEHKVVLPEIDGLSIRASKLTPEEGEEVTLYLSTGSSKRLDAVTLNGSSLEIKESNQKGTKICKFAMPADADAVIDATVVDVYAITVADAVKDSFGIVCDVTSAAEGETVTFKPATYAGYWYKAVVALEDDVALQPKDDGSYSFTMPGHSVTLSATTGENVYAVTWDTEDCNVRVYRLVPSTSNPDNMLQSYLSLGDAVPVGTELHIKVSDSGKRRTVDKVHFNGAELAKNSDDEYIVTMPTYPVNVDVTMKDHIRYLSYEDSEHFSVSLTKKVTNSDGSEQEVAASSALYDDVIYINTTDKTPDTFHKFVVSSYKLFYGNSSEDISKTSSSYTVNVDGDGRHYFKVGDYDYTKVTLTEVESAFKGTNVPGTYKGYKGYYPTTTTVEINEDGTAKFDGTKYKNATNMEGKENAYSLAQDTTYSPKTAYVFANEKENSTALLVDVNGPVLSGRAESLVVAKGLGDFDMDNTFTYMLFESSKVKKQYFHVAYSNGTVDVYYDDETGNAYFDVTVNHISGNGKAVGDKVAIMNGDTILATFEITKIDTKSNGYQHTVKEISSDGLEGTYTKDSSTLLLNGFGGATLDGVAGTYKIDASASNKIIVTINETETAYLLDSENHTFAVAVLPTDGYEGTYSGADGSLVLDGYGVATLGSAEGTYTLQNNVVSVTIGEETHTYSLNKDDGTYSSLSQFASLRFAGSFIDNFNSENNNLYLDFATSPVIEGQIRINNASFFFDFTGTFDASTNKLSLTITKAVNAEFVDKVLEATVTFADDGSIASITFNTNINDSVYNISGTTVTPVAA